MLSVMTKTKKEHSLEFTAGCV